MKFGLDAKNPDHQDKLTKIWRIFDDKSDRTSKNQNWSPDFSPQNIELFVASPVSSLIGPKVQLEKASHYDELCKDSTYLGTCYLCVYGMTDQTSQDNVL